MVNKRIFNPKLLTYILRDELFLCSTNNLSSVVGEVPLYDIKVRPGSVDQRTDRTRKRSSSGWAKIMCDPLFLSSTDISRHVRRWKTYLYMIQIR